MQTGHGIRWTWFARLRDMVFFVSLFRPILSKSFSQLNCICFVFASEKVEHGYYGVTPFDIHLHFTLSQDTYTFAFCLGNIEEGPQKSRIGNGSCFNAHPDTARPISIMERQRAFASRMNAKGWQLEPRRAHIALNIWAI